VRAVEALAHRVERAGADVAVYDAERRQRQDGEVAPVRRGRVRVAVCIRESGVNVCRSCACHTHPERKE
jgi:hypothetical protein